MQTLQAVSDLHLFCRRSHGHLHQETIERALAESDIFVFNGDTFDFRWTTLRTFEDTANASAQWLVNLAAAAPHCAIHVLLGNHDHIPCFMDRLEEATGGTPNLYWDPYVARFGDTVLLHGDAANRRMTGNDLARARETNPHNRRKGEFANRLWDMAFRFGIHKRIPKAVFPTPIVAERLHHYLDDIGHGTASGAAHVYYGHTHLAHAPYLHDGLTFHNGGAPMPGVEFRVLKTEVAA